MSDLFRQLSHDDLQKCSAIITITDKLHVFVGKLHLESNDISDIEHQLKIHPVVNYSNEKILHMLEYWKEKSPEDCTAVNLIQILRDMELCDQADNMETKLSISEKPSGDFNKEKFSKRVIHSRMILEASKIMRQALYKNLARNLGLTPNQIEVVENKCREDFNYIYTLLTEWKEMQGKKATLGDLCNALANMGCKDTAQKVYDKCGPLPEIDVQ